MNDVSAPPTTSDSSASPRAPIRAVLFDVDGTLYHQTPLRLLMAAELAALPLVRRSLSQARTTWRVIEEFRRVREELRDHDKADTGGLLHEVQFIRSAERSGTPFAVVEQIVSEWIDRRPLKHIKRCRRRGLGKLLSFLRSRSIEVGAFSDYPVTEKLAALGVSDHFSVSLSATDPEINTFKPHARGFLRACEIWGIRPRDVLYVGDRADVDARGARAAGMPCAILSAGRDRSVRLHPSGHVHVRSFAELEHVLDSHR